MKVLLEQLFKPEPDGNALSGVVYAANEASLSAAMQSGRVIEAANDANIEGFALSMPLTQMITAVPDPENLQQVLDTLFPPVPVAMFFTYLQENEAEGMIAHANADLIRPVGGEFRTVTTTGTQATNRVFNKGLTIYLDHDQGGNLPSVQQRYVASLRNKIWRSELVAGLDLLDAAAIEEGSTNWGSSTSNPDGDVRASLKTAGDLRGINSNTVLYGNGCWLNRALAYEQAGRTNGGQKASYTPERLAQELDVDNVVNLKVRKRTSATALTGLVNSVVYNYYAQQQATPDDSSNVKRFVREGAGGAMEVFVENMLKRTKLTVSCYSNIVITNSVGIRKRTVTYS